MSPPVWHKAATLAAASSLLADQVALHLAEALSARGHAIMAVPGGTTPRLLLEYIAGKQIAWRAVSIVPTDERLVAADNARSNRLMIAAALQPALAQGARLLDLCGPDLEPEKALAHAEAMLAPLPPLDVLVSGMGADGHIASLFPGDGQILDAAPRHALLARPEGLEARLSLSPWRLMQARYAALLISGVDKHAVLDKITYDTDPLVCPVALLARRNQSPLNIFWSPV